jgi:RNA polymerase sigma-70 factor, ECF subfamily
MPAVSMSASMSDPILRRRWMAEAKAGDAVAFERMLEVHSRTVLRIAQRILLNEADAQDAAQDVFIRLHKTLSQFDDERDLLPWLYRMTVNVCHDLVRRRKPMVAMDQIVELPSVDPGPEEEFTAGERRRLMFEALASLSERERDAIVLRDLEGLSTAEVATALGTTEVTVRSQISTGRVKLKSHIARKIRRQK